MPAVPESEPRAPVKVVEAPPPEASPPAAAGAAQEARDEADVANVAVPEWAKQELDVNSWPQFLLKYIVSHPAVTAAIPGTTTMAYLEDNQAGGRGRLPSAAQRKRMEEFWDALPG